MRTKLIIRENFNDEEGRVVFTIERADGEPLFPADGVKGLNYSTLANAQAQIEKVRTSINNGGGQL